MLYVTSRNKRETYPARKAISENRCADGGLYMPMRLLPLSWAELKEMGRQPFNETLAQTLNFLFGTKLTRWDLEFSTGRHPVRLTPMSHQIVMGELWHNVAGDYSDMVRRIGRLIDPEGEQTHLLKTGVSLAVLFGVFAALIREGLADQDQKVDVVCVTGDLSEALAAAYGRQMGLPIGNIVCCCNENGGLWDLLVNGQLRTDGVAVSTATPEADILLPENLECLISLSCGEREVQRYLEAREVGGVYAPEEELLKALRRGLQVCVVSGARMHNTIPNVYSTADYLLSPYSALAYAGLLDYRARAGESRWALVLADRSPERDADAVAAALGMGQRELTALLRKI